jgi:hypothetical protein
MVKPEMILETVDVMPRVQSQGITVNVPVNNRAGAKQSFACARSNGEVHPHKHTQN